jgi:hypothetical protein
MKKILFFSILLILYLTITLYSQPRLILHITGGYSLPLPDLKGDLPGSANDNNYHMSGALNLGADGMFAIDKKGYAGVIANLFSNHGNHPILATTQTLKINILTAGLGLQFNFPKIKQFRPFISSQFTWNLFTGSLIIDPVDTVPTTENHMVTESRFGLLFGAGAEISVHEDFGFVAGVKYSIANLIGKDSASVSDVSYALWDSQYTYNGRTITAKKIQYLQFYAGVSIYLMKPKVKKKW